MLMCQDRFVGENESCIHLVKTKEECVGSSSLLVTKANKRKSQWTTHNYNVAINKKWIVSVCFLVCFGLLYLKLKSESFWKAFFR